MKNTEAEAKQGGFFCLVLLLCLFWFDFSWLASRASLDKAEFPVGELAWSSLVTSTCLVAFNYGMYVGVCTWMMILPTSLLL